jgi:hypothetical protein
MRHMGATKAFVLGMIEAYEVPAGAVSRPANQHATVP